MDVGVPRSARIEALRSLIAMPELSIASVLAVLNPLATLGVEVGEAVLKARDAVASVPGGDSRHEAIARYMVARVVVMLEQDAMTATVDREAVTDQD